MKYSATVILLTYNQENYVSEAVQSLLNQDVFFDKLIISDDHSKDGTFEILQSEILHNNKLDILLLRNEVNLGLTRHLNKVLQLVDTDIVIMAAGDDISLNTRVSQTIAAFEKYPDIYAVHSPVLQIDVKGAIIGLKIPPLKGEYEPKCALWEGTIIGATAAYKMDLYHKFGPLAFSGVYEDLIYSFRASLLGRVHMISDPLVYYRYGIGISTDISRNKKTWSSYRLAQIENGISDLQQKMSDYSKVKSEFSDQFELLLIGLENRHFSYSFYKNNFLFFVKTIFRRFLYMLASGLREIYRYYKYFKGNN